MMVAAGPACGVGTASLSDERRLRCSCPRGAANVRPADPDRQGQKIPEGLIGDLADLLPEHVYSERPVGVLAQYHRNQLARPRVQVA